jgi:hypothetical protein
MLERQKKMLELQQFSLTFGRTRGRILAAQSQIALQTLDGAVHLMPLSLRGQQRIPMELPHRKKRA